MSRDEIIKYFNKKWIPPYTYLIVIASPFIAFFLQKILTDWAFNSNSSMVVPLMMGAGISGTILPILPLVWFAWYLMKKRDNITKRLDSYCDSLTDEFLAEKNRFYANSGIAISDRFSAGRYCFENIFTQRKSVKGRDGIWRSSIFETECFFISGDTLFRNVRKVSLVSDEKVETSSEIPIKEISTISAEETNGASYVILSTPGENLRIKCPNAAALCAKLKMIKTELSKTGSE